MPANRLARPTVLVVDDDDDIRTTIRDVLEGQGFAVACAATGREALEMLRHDERKPALILFDLTLPALEGWIFRQEQQKVPWLAQIPVVLFSGHYDAARVAQSLNVAALMNQPLRLEGLVVLVGQLARRGKPN